MKKTEHSKSSSGEPSQNPSSTTGGLWQDHTLIFGSSTEIPESSKGSTVLLGFPCDEGVRRNNGRPGAKAGPEELRKVLARLAWHFPGELLDAGDIPCFENDLEAAQIKFGSRIGQLLKSGKFPIGIGGGHEIAFGHYSGIRDFIGDSRLGIINFDAHFDMRIPINHKGNSGTPFYQIARHCSDHEWPFDYLCIGLQKENNTAQLFQTASQNNAHWIEASDVHMIHFETLKKQVDLFMENVEHIYISFCLDVFNASVAPGVSAVNPLGLFPDIVLNLTRHIVCSRKVISLDIAELNPLYDIDHRTAKLAAALIFNVMEWKSTNENGVKR